MLRADVRDKLITALRNVNGVKTDPIIDTDKLGLDLGLDSVDFIELAIEMEAEFGIEISDLDFPKLETVGDVLNYLCDKTAVKV